MRRQANNRLLTFGLLTLVTLGILAIGQRSGMLRPVVTVLMAPLRPIAGLVTDGMDAATSPGDRSASAAELRERNRLLERTIAELQVEIVRLREIESDYYRLAGLVDYAADRPDQNLIAADVIARDTSSYLRWIVVNRGARDGIQVGDPVISDLGLVGRVEDVAANAAWVILVIDPNSTVNARLQGSRAEGTVFGQLQGGLEMGFIPQDAAVEVGDLVVTSGLGGAFPANIVIGVVTSVRSQPAELFQQAEVRPVVDFGNLEIVAVITDFQPVDPALFEETIEERTPEQP